MKRDMKKITAAIVSVAVLLSSLTVTGFAADDSSNDNMNGLKNEYIELQTQQKELREDLARVQDDKAKKEELKENVEKEIQLIEQQIQVLDTQTKLLVKDIRDKEDRIEQKQKEISSEYELFKKRLRAMYMAGDTSVLEILLGSGSYADMLTRTDTVKRITEYDQELITSLNDDLEELGKTKKQLLEDKGDLEKNRSEVTEKKKELADKKQEIVDQISNIEEMEREFRDNRDQASRKMQAIRDEVEKLYGKLDPMFEEDIYVGGDFSWPLPGFYGISSEYGLRFDGSDFHTGIDITGGGVENKDIVAANDGIVSAVRWDEDGYGNYFIIDHGGGYTTLYAHCNKVLVSEGQEVLKGQTVAKVGSTGWSTGPHLHFEIRLNGKTSDPLEYFQD